MPFLKWHIDMTIQLQVLMMYVHKSIIYATTLKAHIHKLSISKAPRTQQVEC